MAIRILLIDDDPDTVNILQHTLAKEGYEVFSCKNSTLGILSATKNHPNLILCDISMPEMDGHQVQQELKKNPQTAKIPIIMITGTRGIDSVQKSFDLGAQSYMTKPLDLEKVKEKIKYILIITGQYQEK